MYVCPHCNKSVKDLKGHIRRAHPDKVEKLKETSNVSDSAFEVKKPAEIKEPKADQPETGGGYHCVDCGGAVSKGQSSCPHCGATLDWSQVQ